ncbi:hypothetical protein TW86_03700 [Halomonas sp. S2151]|uniref:hypothetical protein n=1 Tax=Halomonas sp. S2151 TaxID=579478 RepID=UPI0005FA3E43|nr:hypothetical protein [Halomonas sp. S2151]KJZ17371.1 hypothetical protein TW86_03700 [Halomonas sp. S2151]
MSQHHYTCRAKKILQLAIGMNGGTTLFTVDTFKGSEQSRINGGTLTISGDFGPWGYTWTHCGEGSFLDFLTGLSFDYAMNKLASRSEMQRFDDDGTRKEIVRRIIELRREGVLQREQARAYYDGVQDHSFCDHHEVIEVLSDIAWHESVNNGDFCYSRPTTLFEAVYGNDPYNVSLCHSPAAYLETFWEHVWPVFLVELGKVLAEQENAA